MQTLKLIPGDFMKNAGIVGFLRLMEFARNRAGATFSVTDEFDVEELLALDLAQLYIDTFVEVYGKETSTYKRFQEMHNFLKQLKEEGSIDVRKKVKEWEGISKEFLRAHCKAGLEGIGQLEIYEWLTDLEVSEQSLSENRHDLVVSIDKIYSALAQPIVINTLLFKAVMYDVICHFWGGVFKKNRQTGLYEFYFKEGTKSIFYEKKANIREKIDKDFVKAFKDYISTSSHRGNLSCIECGDGRITKTGGKKISLFLNMADDLSRKTSAFWNCRPDAYLCPVCAFLYVLAPLGFTPVDNGDFVFVNANSSVEMLYTNNHAKLKDDQTRYTYHERIDLAIRGILEKKTREVENIQVVTRSGDENRYHFNVIDRDVLRLFQDPDAKSAFLELSERKAFKLSNGNYCNVYRECVYNVLNYRNQYGLLNLLIFESLKNPGVSVFVLTIQRTQLLLKENSNMDLKNQQHFAAKAGSELRALLVASKAGVDAEDVVRSPAYQLTNALKVQNVDQFTDIIIRLYMSLKKPIPTVFLQALKSEDQFNMIGYAFILGLKGSFYDGKNQESQTLNEGENHD